MKVRDGYANLNGTGETFEFKDIQILTENDQVMFDIRQDEDGTLHVTAGNTCKFNGRLLDDKFVIQPIAVNKVKLIKEPLVVTAPTSHKP